MVFTPTTLPDLDTLDADALKVMLLATHERFTAQQEELLAAREQLLSRDHEIEHLKLLIAKLRRMQLRRFREVTRPCSREVTHLLGNQELN
jgi:hypothetical protein